MNPDTKALAVEALEMARSVCLSAFKDTGMSDDDNVIGRLDKALTALTQPPPVSEIRERVVRIIAKLATHYIGVGRPGVAPSYVAPDAGTVQEATDRILALLPQPPGSDGEWQGIESAPRDGTVFWAWLYQTGIRQMRWATPLECAEEEGGAPEDYDGCFVEVADFYGEWSPKFWLPLSAIPEPSALAASPTPPSPSTEEGQ